MSWQDPPVPVHYETARRYQQARRSGASITAVPGTEWCGRCNHPVSQPCPRVYCPSCGEVRCYVVRQGIGMTMPHYRGLFVDADELPHHKGTCPGGEVDYEERRAP